MQAAPKHTFVVLAYKESPYIEECVRSLKDQTDNCDIVVSTSTPSPFLDHLVSKFSLRMIVNRDSSGIATDWSFAYNNVKTDFVTLAHQDDLYHSDYVRECLLAAENHKDNLITFTSYNELINDAKREITLNLLIKRLILAFFFPLGESVRSRFLKRLMLAFGSPIPCPSVMFNRKTIGPFQFCSDFSVNMDWDAWMRLAERDGAFLHVKKGLMTHRIHQDSQTTIGIGQHIRQTEDRTLFSRVWPEPLAALIARLYSLSYKSNQ